MQRLGRAKTAILLLILCVVAGLASCTAMRMPGGPGATVPHIQGSNFIASDGMALPIRIWEPDPDDWAAPKAVILALHGFNDYSNAFESAGSWWAERGFVTYAYDQRGFGETRHRGLWAGSDVLAEDLKTLVHLVAARHEGVPVYLLGESMGAAVVTVALTSPNPPAVDGAILSAPAVWSRASMPIYQRVALWVAARTIPWARFSGSGLRIQASDNIEMLRGLGRDPLVIKRTRVDAMDGLTDLMTEALAAAPRLEAEALVLYGDKDEVVPKGPVFRFWRNLPAEVRSHHRFALYDQGWHMLLRDLGAETVLADIASWMTDRGAPLPSGADRKAAAALAGHAEETVALDMPEDPASATQ